MTLFLDMDGVLADFDKRATEVLGMDSYRFEWRFGTEEFWKRLDAVDDFFYSFDPMPDAFTLWDAVEDLDPIVLTALPRSGAAKVEKQKRAWIVKHLGVNVPVITCLTKEKPLYMTRGDILVDDRNANEKAIVAKGGSFVHHMDAYSSIVQLRDLGVI